MALKRIWKIRICSNCLKLGYEKFEERQKALSEKDNKDEEQPEINTPRDIKAYLDEWVIEQERPIGEPCEQFKDVDKISTYITKWFTRQMQRVFDLSTGEEDDN